MTPSTAPTTDLPSLFLRFGELNKNTPGQGEKQCILAGDPASIEDVEELEAQFFTVKLLPGVVSDGRAWARLIFPATLPVAVRDKTELIADHWRMDLPLISGHCYVQAWYLAMSKALASWCGANPEPQRGDETMIAPGDALSHVACLLECALTVTIHAKLCTSDMELGLFSNQISETSKANEKLVSDTFPAFTAKALLIIGSPLDGKIHPPNVRLGVLQQSSVRYNGALVNRTMWAAVQLFDSKVNEQSKMVLMRIERFAGKECLTKHYAKLMRVGQLCAKEAEKSDNASVQGLIQYTLEALLWRLRHVKMAGFKLDWLEKQVPVLLSRREMATRVYDLVTDLGRTSVGEDLVKKELQAVVGAFQSYMKFEVEFAKGQDDADPVYEFKKRHACDSKVALLMVDLLYDVLSGVYDGDLAKARAAAQGKSASGDGRINLLKAKGFDSYREVYRLISLAQSSVDLAPDAGAPKTASKQLRRYQSDPVVSAGDDRECNRVKKRDCAGKKL